MFTGIVTDVGRVRAVQRPPEGEAGDLRFVFETSYDPQDARRRRVDIVLLRASA